MRKRSLRLLVLLLVISAFGCSGCQTTLQKDPAPHELLAAVEGWPDEYYWLVETGVSSRVLGLRQPGERLEDALVRVERMLDMVRGQWQTIAGLPSAQAIMDHLKAHNLVEVAGAIQQSLDANQATAPGGHTHTFLQARAVKQGLIGAYRKIKELRG
jgi:hypothetical protein